LEMELDDGRLEKLLDIYGERAAAQGNVRS
jgi:hypothetical protein